MNEILIAFLIAFFILVMIWSFPNDKDETS
jgi:hypothetical protein